MFSCLFLLCADVKLHLTVGVCGDALLVFTDCLRGLLCGFDWWEVLIRVVCCCSYVVCCGGLGLCGCCLFT